MLSLFQRGCPILPDIAAGICYRTGIFALSFPLTGSGISPKPLPEQNTANAGFTAPSYDDKIIKKAEQDNN